MKPLLLLGAGLGLSAALGGGLLHRPELSAALFGAPTPALTATAATAATAGTAADRRTVIAGTDPVSGANSGTGGFDGWTRGNLRIDRSIMGGTTVAGAPTVSLPELVLDPPGPGKAGSITTQHRTLQSPNTATWTGQVRVDGPVHRITRRTALNSYVVVPAEAGQLHLLCSTTTTTYEVDSSAGEWRVHRADGGPGYDFSYRFVRYDKSPTADQSSCR